MISEQGSTWKSPDCGLQLEGSSIRNLRLQPAYSMPSVSECTCCFRNSLQFPLYELLGRVLPWRQDQSRWHLLSLDPAAGNRDGVSPTVGPQEGCLSSGLSCCFCASTVNVPPGHCLGRAWLLGWFLHSCSSRFFSFADPSPQVCQRPGLSKAGYRVPVKMCVTSSGQVCSSHSKEPPLPRTGWFPSPSTPDPPLAV